MSFLKMLITALGKALNGYGARQAQQFIEIHLRHAGYDDDYINIAREAVAVFFTELITALMTRILRILDSV
ncbi:TPA: hypothetical protein SMP74_002967 [Proteus mirabilis]|uniref:hypothetical protein n=2 Tax=Proteus mirabilis TaxID=584 RepID=UPI000665CC4C|nr:hypothetical protein [Proteus mirabilis]MDD8914938.1 hypothetical protein [Escherichia coli]ELA7680541.1 hypothetical protein [Proteus mirabilis]ELB1713079.1 hypothetical protein [Proteus mirabilis]MBB6650935.1 hypothetical protein [Proteus mirabilis]MBI6205369.1 hypothetical protein [Proteus mirabilis]